jgi:hypothetical protein
MAKQTTNTPKQTAWVNHTIWIAAILLLGFEMGFATDYLLACLPDTFQSVHAWLPNLSCMAWAMVDHATCHAASYHSAHAALALSAMPLFLLGTTVVMARRTNS